MPPGKKARSYLVALALGLGVLAALAVAAALAERPSIVGTGAMVVTVGAACVAVAGAIAAGHMGLPRVRRAAPPRPVGSLAVTAHVLVFAAPCGAAFVILGLLAG